MARGTGFEARAADQARKAYAEIGADYPESARRRGRLPRPASARRDPMVYRRLIFTLSLLAALAAHVLPWLARIFR